MSSVKHNQGRQLHLAPVSGFRIGLFLPRERIAGSISTRE
jgi:hypothetical protein